MFTIKNILAPIDFSERASAGADHAIALARQFDSQLLFLHVIKPVPHEYSAFDQGFYVGGEWLSSEALQKSVQATLDDFIAKCKSDRPIEALLRDGDPALEIEKVVAERGIDLVVMPTHGYGRFRRLLLGSVTSKVLHDISIPILTGAHVEETPPLDPAPYRRIACAVDLDEHGEHTLQWAWDFARALGRGLTVIHAAPQIEVGGTYGDWFPPETRMQVVDSATKRLQELMDKVGCDGETRVESSQAPHYIAEVAQEIAADVVIIGRSRHGALRATAPDIIRQAPCAVISI